jgi:hypothetical protein
MAWESQRDVAHCGVEATPLRAGVNYSLRIRAAIASAKVKWPE